MTLISSNIGKQSISINTTSIYIFNKYIIFLGKYGTLKMYMSNCFLVRINTKSKLLTISPIIEDKSYKKQLVKSLWGTYQALMKNAIIGTSIGLKQFVELIGLGYRGLFSDNTIKLKIGKSHEVSYPMTDHLEGKFVNNTLFTIRGVNKQKIRQLAFNLYKLKKPDPYKNKGIKLPEMVLFKKQGKKQK